VGDGGGIFGIRENPSDIAEQLVGHTEKTLALGVEMSGCVCDFLLDLGFRFHFVETVAKERGCRRLAEQRGPEEED
jgi:hypothetical protein